MSGMPIAKTERSISATPTEVSTPAFSVPSRILRTTSGSSPATPPGKRRTVTRPPEACFQRSPVSFRIWNQDEPSGTSVAIRMMSGACASTGRAGSQAAHTASATSTRKARCLRDLTPRRSVIVILSRPLARRGARERRSLDEQLVGAAELEARALLREQVGDALRALLADVERERLLHQLLELRLVLLDDAHVLGEDHVRE